MPTINVARRLATNSLTPSIDFSIRLAPCACSPLPQVYKLRAKRSAIGPSPQNRNRPFPKPCGCGCAIVVRSTLEPTAPPLTAKQLQRRL
jgi:hypothetical protein